MKERKLGKVRSPNDRRQLRLSRYLEPSLSPPPDTCDWGKTVNVPWGMYVNDQWGDCVEAAACHMIMSWTANGQGLFVPTEEDCLKAYSDITGFVRGDPATDNGTMPIDCLKYWRTTGIAGRKIGAWTQVKSREELMQSTFLFGGCYIGLNLPKAAQSMDEWHVPCLKFLYGDFTPGSWGGHMVESQSYDDKGVTCITWGEPKRITWQFLSAYADEVYAILSEDMLRVDGLAPVGLDIETLRADLELVSSLPVQISAIAEARPFLV